SEGSLSSDGSGTSAGCADGSSGSTTCTEDDSGCGEVASCSISLIERLIRSHPIWFLPGIQRAGAFHLLQGKEEGNFVVRQSSQSDTMALSVRLPVGKGPYIEHYLIQANKGKLSLETSENRFDNIPSLIAHYSQCCDELPVQLTLPRAMREAKNRQQLSSLALLGQEFWRYPMANPKPPESGNSSNTSSLSSFHAAANASQTPSPLPTSTTPSTTPGLPRQPRPTPPNTLNLTQLNGPLTEAQCARWDGRQLSPSDKLSQRLVSPNLVQHHQQHLQQQQRCDESSESAKMSSGARFTPSNPCGPTSNFQRNIAGSTSSLNSSRCAGQLQLQLGLTGHQQHQLTRSESNSPMTPDSKHASPFYAEPADALPRALLLARRRPRLAPGANGRAPGKFGRHSEPGSWLQLQLLPTATLAGCTSDSCPDEYSDEPASGCGAGEASSGDRAPLISSSSADNVAKRPLVVQQAPRQSSSQHQHHPKNRHKLFSDTSWAVDSSWEFIGNDADDCEPDYDCDRDYDVKNSGQKCCDEKKNKYNSSSKSLTAQSIILQRYPELLRLPETTESLYSDRNSSYDNVERRQERIFQQQQQLSKGPAINAMTTPTMTPTESQQSRGTDRAIFDPSESETILDTDDSDAELIKRRESFRERLDPLMSPPRLQVLRNNENAGGPGCAGSAIRTYALQLAADRTTTFSQNIENFIQCTKESKEASPHVVMRNMRQFMSGMKNYLVKHGEREFEREVEKERLKLKANEFLNLDAILENVMMHLVVRPLREHVYRLFVEHYASNGSLQTLAESMQLAQQKHIQDLGVRPKIIAPTEANLDRILSHIEKLQIADSPLEKLENLLAAISAIVNSVKHANSGRSVTLGADDLLPLLVWVLVRGRVVDAEIEAEYMWGLLHSSLLTGEGGYYLTTLSSAVHVLKTFKSSQGTMSTNNGCGSPDCSSVLRVLVPDELHGSLNTKILPLRPNMNTRDICRILAHKIRCTNPQDYGLFKLVQGEETLLGDQECPQELSHCLFAFKRIDAKIAWPRTTSSGYNGGSNSSS
ncbi:hypothetical protein QAD02_020234, partial [Eretmocerus hayati]